MQQNVPTDYTMYEETGTRGIQQNARADSLQYNTK